MSDNRQIPEVILPPEAHITPEEIKRLRGYIHGCRASGQPRMNQPDFAKMWGVSIRTLAGAETGERRITPRKAAAMLAMLAEYEKGED